MRASANHAFSHRSPVLNDLPPTAMSDDAVLTVVDEPDLVPICTPLR